MKRYTISTLFTLLALTCLMVFAQEDTVKMAPAGNDKIVKTGLGNLAVISPSMPEELDANSKDAFWQALETIATRMMHETKQFNLIARSDNTFRSLINEIRFQGTQLVGADGRRMQPNQIRSVDTILCASVGRFNTKYTLSIYLVNARSEIKSEFTSFETYNSLEDVVENLEYSMAKLFQRLDIRDAMLINPIFPDGVAQKGEAFTNALQHQLTDKATMVASHNLEGLLKEMKKEKLEDITERDWMRFHRITAVRYLIVPRFSLFEVSEPNEAVNPYDNQKHSWCDFGAEATITIIDTTNGNAVASKAVEHHKASSEVYSKANPAKKMEPTEFKRIYPAIALRTMAEELAPEIGDALQELLQQPK